MQLSLDMLKTLMHGALGFDVDTDGYLHFHRFTEAQRAHYKEHNLAFYEKAHSTANMRLCVVTDAESLSFDYIAFKASSRKFYYFDLFVDGVMIDHRGEEGCTEGKGRMTFALPRGTHTVTLYLPPLFGVALKDVTLEGATMAAPTQKSRRVLMLGDSITQGYDAMYPSQSYANLVTDMLHATSVNQAIGGEIFNPAIIDGDLGFTPDMITVALGTNDYSTCTREKMTAAANEFYRRLRELFPKTPIFALLPIWRGDTEKPRAIASFEEAKAIVRAAAEAQPNTVIIDGNTFVPHLPEFFSDKHLHPNDMGFKFYADALFAALMPHVNEV